jgi:hypothetical protein
MSRETVVRKGNVSRVLAGVAYYNPGSAMCEVTNTGNGYIVKFPSHNSVTQDYYVCLDYAQAYDMILGLAAFKEDLGFV